MTIETEQTKTVSYLEVEYTVPKWANLVAADVDGRLFIYSSEPYLEDGRYMGSETRYITTLEIPVFPCVPC